MSRCPHRRSCGACHRLVNPVVAAVFPFSLLSSLAAVVGGAVAVAVPVPIPVVIVIRSTWGPPCEQLLAAVGAGAGSSVVRRGSVLGLSCRCDIVKPKEMNA
jgi:hypothetical protein